MLTRIESEINKLNVPIIAKKNQYIDSIKFSAQNYYLISGFLANSKYDSQIYHPAKFICIFFIIILNPKSLYLIYFVVVK